MRSFQGGCHCGAVRFEFKVSTESTDDDDDAKILEALDCNCSICTMKGIEHYIVPESDFSLLSGADHLSVYTFNTHVAKHMFCRTCGIHPFYRPRSHPDCYDINIRCLDGDARSLFKVVPFNGRNWEAEVHTIRDEDKYTASSDSSAATIASVASTSS